MNCKYMAMAYNEALMALKDNEVPVGVVIVKNDCVIASTHNLKEHFNCSIYHAEILAIIEASRKISNWRLSDCDMYVTLEPCPMCASAIKQARIKNVYCGLANSDLKNGEIIKSIFQSNDINPKVNFYNNLYVEEVKKIMQQFFDEKRNM